MKVFTVNPHDGTIGNVACGKCCCTTVVMRPDETDKFQINYAPWSYPIGGLGLVQGGTVISITRDSDACPSGQIDGFGPPNFAIQTVVGTGQSGDAMQIDLNALGGIQPVGNTFTSEVLLLSGPKHGSITPRSNPTHQYTYTPDSGFFGTDVAWFKVTDAQGRSVIRPAYFRTLAGAPDAPRQDGALGLFVDRLKMRVDTAQHTLTFPIHLGPDAQRCDKFRLEVVQSARDCNDLYTHYSCYDIVVGDC